MSIKSNSQETASKNKKTKHTLQPCELCSIRPAEHCHHIEFDKETNKSNKQGPTQMICTLCHAKIHGIEPRISELRRLVILYGRTQKARIAIENQIRGLSRIEIIIPSEFSALIKDTQKLEKQYSKAIKQLLEGEDQALKENHSIHVFPLYSWLTSIKGISHLLAGKLLSCIDFNKTSTVSSLWCYAGQTPDSKRKKGKTANWNQELKAACFMIGDSFIKQRTPKYREIYDKEKERQLSLLETKKKEKTTRDKSQEDNIAEPDQRGVVSHRQKVGSAPTSKMHAHRRASRKAVKEFLKDFWIANKSLSGDETTLKEKTKQCLSLTQVVEVVN